jgi:hypothetical protein
MLLRAIALIGLVSLSAGGASAQSIGGPHDIPRIYGPGGARSTMDEPFSHRYNYYTGPALYLNGNPRELWNLDYLDRLDRAERFGYRHPLPPPQLYESEHQHHHRPRIFGGFGIFKRY